MALEIKESTARKLFSVSGNQCAKPECQKTLVPNETTNFGELCHIKGENPGSKRYDKEMSGEERRDYSNIIILCSNCHILIDSDDITYPEKLLKKWKKEHELSDKNPFELSDSLLKQLLEREHIRVEQINSQNSSQLVVSGQNNLVTQGIPSNDLITIIKMMMGNNEEFSKKSQIKMTENMDNFAKIFVETGLKKISESNKEKFADPDLRFTLENALKTASRKDDETLHQVLSSLIVQRIESKENLEEIVFNEAILVMGKLTENQLKIIALCFILRYTTRVIDATKENLINFYHNCFEKLFPISITNTQLGYIESVSCGSSSIGSWKILSYFHSSFSALFMNPFQTTQLPKNTISEEIQNELFEKPVGDSIKCKFSSEVNLKEFLEKSEYDESLQKRILNLYNANNPNNPQKILETLAKIIPDGDFMEFLKNDKQLKHFGLTAVGIAIAINYLEVKTGDTFDYKIWIN